ncbi:MAG: DUF6064 family protein [Gemmatimonadota bacterium]
MPFTETQFLDVFARYNEAIWPLQVAAYALGLAIVVLLLRGRPHWVSLSLAPLWVFTGVSYFAAFFAQINPVARAFGALFVLQGVLLIHSGVGAKTPRTPRAPHRTAGLALIAYALVLYPLLGLLFGHVYPRAPVFGVTPCPLVIFTLGALLIESRLPGRLFVIPLVWSAVGGSAAWLLGVREDLGLLAAGVIAIAALWSVRRNSHRGREIARGWP